MSYRDVLRDFNLYVDGIGYAGQLKEYVPPKLTIIEEDYRAAGMDAPLGIDLGMEKLVAECTLGAYDADILGRVGQTLLDTTFVIRGALVTERDIPTPVVHTLVAKGVRAIDPGTWKPGEMAELKFTIHPHYYRIDHGTNLALTEIDVRNGIRRVQGIDHLESIRAIVGR